MIIRCLNSSFRTRLICFFILLKANLQYLLITKKHVMEKQTKLYEVGDKLTVSWNKQVRALINTWSPACLYETDLKKALQIGLLHLISNKGIAWIVNTQTQNSYMPLRIQNYIGTTVFPSCVKNGVKYFITINSKIELMPQSYFNFYTNKAVETGLIHIEVNSIDNAIKWLNINRA